MTRQIQNPVKTSWGTFFIKTPSGKTIEFEPMEDGGAKPVLLIMPDGQVFFEDDLKNAEHEAKKFNHKYKNLLK